jgi:hypothetical protein
MMCYAKLKKAGGALYLVGAQGVGEALALIPDQAIVLYLRLRLNHPAA